MVSRVQGVALLAAAVLLSACGTKLPGKFYELSDGTALEFQIERSYGMGGTYAQNPKTGEKFSGQYTAIAVGGGVAASFGNSSLSGTSTNLATGTMYRNTGAVANTTTTFVPPANATSRGIGVRRTVIELYMMIRRGPVPKGHGEGVDNKGARYQVQL